jgi:hypothetical protein
LLSKLTILECKGIIKRVYGGNYVIIKSWFYKIFCYNTVIAK